MNFQLERELESAFVALLSAQGDVASDGDIDVFHEDDESQVRREEWIDVNTGVDSDMGWGPQAMFGRTATILSVHTAKAADQNASRCAAIMGYVRTVVHQKALPAILRSAASNGLDVLDRSARVGEFYKVPNQREHIQEIIINCVITQR